MYRYFQCNDVERSYRDGMHAARNASFCYNWGTDWICSKIWRYVRCHFENC